MISAKTILHQGFVKKIEDDGVSVQFTSRSACADCHAKGVCSAADLKEKELKIYSADKSLNPGDPVDISISLNDGSKAVLIGYVYPLLFFLSSLLILSSAGVDEVKTGIFSLGAPVIYYFFIFSFRKKINRKFHFTIRKSG